MSEFSAWLMHPETKKLREEIRRKREEIKDQLGMGKALDYENAVRTLGLSAKKDGELSILREIEEYFRNE